jgi:LuxR family maltose regulon positive regulatory protein
MCYQWNDLEASTRHLEKAIEIYRLSVRGIGLEIAYLYLARTRAAAGDVEKAMKSLDDADLLISHGETDPGSLSINAAYHAAIALMEGDEESAARWIDSLTESDVFILLVTSISASSLFWARKGGNKVAKKAQLLCEQLAQQGSMTGVVCVKLVQALDSLGPGNPEDCLAEALSMCKSMNALRVIIDIGMEVVPLLRQAVTKGIEPEFARKLINIIESEDRQRKIRKGELPQSAISSAILSDREMEVLLLMASGLSDRQIAGKLVISLSTAKTHVHRILEKLNATSRMQAVTQAKELKLI